MEIIGRGGHLLPEMAVGEAYGAEGAPVRVEIIAFAVNQPLRMLGEKLDMLAARAGVVEDDVGRAQLGMGGGDPREWRRDVSERGGARVGLALAAEDRRIGRLDVTLQIGRASCRERGVQSV